MLEADYQFRCVNGHLHLPKLRAALEAHFIRNVTANSVNEDQRARNDHGAATRSSTGLGDNFREPLLRVGEGVASEAG
jgi:hypothetical protein